MNFTFVSFGNTPPCNRFVCTLQRTSSKHVQQRHTHTSTSSDNPSGIAPGIDSGIASDASGEELFGVSPLTDSLTPLLLNGLVVVTDAAVTEYRENEGILALDW